MVLLSASRNTELVPMAKILASSWVTITTVAPRLSRGPGLVPASEGAHQLLVLRPGASLIHVLYHDERVLTLCRGVPLRQRLSGPHVQESTARA